jgi:hypothetical protein
MVSCFGFRDTVTQGARSSASQQRELQEKETGECGDRTTEAIHGESSGRIC